VEKGMPNFMKYIRYNKKYNEKKKEKEIRERRYHHLMASYLSARIGFLGL